MPQNHTKESSNENLIHKTSVNPPKIHINAEHQRLLWLNFNTSYLLIIIFCYLFLLFFKYANDNYLFETTNNNMVSESIIPWDSYIYIGTWGAILSLLIIVILIRRSLVQDISSRFWDQIRMSSLSPWQITWTRLFTTPLVLWISFLIGITITNISIFNLTQDSSYNILTSKLSYILMIEIGGAIIFTTLVLIDFLQSHRSAQEWQGSAIQMFLLAICLSSFCYLFAEKSMARDYPSYEYINIYAESIDHFFDNSQYFFPTFAVCIMIAAIILLFSAIQSVKFNLHLRSSYLYWCIIAVFSPFIFWLVKSFYYVDFSLLPIILFFCYSLYCVVSVSTQDNRPTRLKLGLSKLKNGKIVAAIDTLPLWIIVFPICFMIALIYNVLTSFHAFGLFRYLFYLFLYIIIHLLSIRYMMKFNRITLSMIYFIMITIFIKLIFSLI